MEKIDKAIEILQAFKEGKTIEYRSKISSTSWNNWRKWIGIPTEILSSTVEYRIKPQLTYRPYANAEEFLKASKEHGGWISHKTNIKELYLITNVDVTNNCVMVVHQMGNSYHCGCNFYSFELLFTNFIWVDDNTPCGILEQ